MKVALEVAQEASTGLLQELTDAIAVAEKAMDDKLADLGV